jgi:hypothetical protein
LRHAFKKRSPTNACAMYPKGSNAAKVGKGAGMFVDGHKKTAFVMVAKGSFAAMH